MVIFFRKKKKKKYIIVTFSWPQMIQNFNKYKSKFTTKNEIEKKIKKLLSQSHDSIFEGLMILFIYLLLLFFLRGWRGAK